MTTLTDVPTDASFRRAAARSAELETEIAGTRSASAC